MAKKLEISPESLLSKFRTTKEDEQFFDLELTTSQVSDALKKVACENGVIHGIKPVKENIKIMGRVVTAKTDTGDWGTVLKAIDIAKEGDILFIDAENGDKAVWGELTSESAQKKGINGTVVYGAVRDVESIRNLNYPVYSCKVVPCAGEAEGEGEVNVNLECQGVKIKPGDLIIGDDCGIVLVPSKHLQKVMKEAFEIKKNEDELSSRIKSGWSLSEILGI